MSKTIDLQVEKSRSLIEGYLQQKQIVKAAYDQEDWRRYGIMDKR